MHKLVQYVLQNTMPETKLQITEYEIGDEGEDKRTVTQYRTTIPKDLAEALIDGDEATIEWSIQSATSLRAEFK